MARRYGSMKIGECRMTWKGMRFCRKPEGVRFVGKGRGRMSEIGFDNLGEPALRPGECMTVHVRGGERKLCNIPSVGARFTRGRRGISVGDPGRRRRPRRRRTAY